MSEAAAASAAPTAAPTSNGVAPTVESTSKTGPDKGRANDGKFLPKNGEVAVAAEPPKPGPHYKTKLKVNGQEQDVEYATEADLQKELQLSRFAATRAREAAEAEKKAKAEQAAWLVRLKGGDEELFKENGIDLDELAAKRLAAKARRELMTPEQRELEELKAYREKTQPALEKAANEKHEAALEQYSQALWAQMEPGFHVALEKHKLTSDPSAMQAIARVGTEFLDAGIDLAPDQVVAEVARQEDAFVWEKLKSYDVPQLVQRLGPEKIQAIVKHFRDEWMAKQGRTQVQPRAESTSRPKPAPDKTFVDEKQYRKNLGLK